ncbi:hypothetical protein IJD44_00900 [bacterium]|nr:hypothetical protein [bacterium]
MNYLLNFINKAIKENRDWMKELESAPYCLKIKEKNNYFLFKYNQYESDMSLPIVQEARGVIVKTHDAGAEYVCRPFSKFFNYGEENACEIDWSSARVLEKIDGSLMKLWWDGKWRLSTNGGINAFEVSVGELNKTFGELFEEVLGKSVEELGQYFCVKDTIMFELVSLENKIVVDYPEARIYYLGHRNNYSGKERFDTVNIYEYNLDCENDKEIKIPQSYLLKSLDLCVEFVNTLTNYEGFVVCDKNFNRIKIKSEDYLLHHRALNNGVLTRRRFIKMLKEDMLDDYLAYTSKSLRFISKQFLADLDDFYNFANKTWEENKCYSKSRKEFAKKIYDFPSGIKSFLFSKLDNEELSVSEWLMSKEVEQIVRTIWNKS